jgi:Rieske Fe-S protein
VITVVFGFLWAREATREYRGEPVRPPEPEPAPARAYVTEGERTPEEEAADRFPRSTFLELSTLGIGALITGIVTAPILGFAVLPAFVGQGTDDIDIGAVDDFPEGDWRIVTFFLDPSQGEVTRRTAYVRYNGELPEGPSFTILSNRCVHLGCPVQPGGLPEDESAEEERTDTGEVRRIPVSPTGFTCPCHGGQYDTEGNRTAGPPVRALDRYEYKISNRRVVLTGTYSVGDVEGTGAEAMVKKYPLTGPGQHVDGLSSWLYPIQPPGR